MSCGPARRLLTLAGLAFALSYCRTVPLPETRRVVLVSFDGMSADDLRQLLQSDKLTDGLKKMAEEGRYARVVPVNPSLTAPAHISIATGATPQHTGIVSNTFHTPGAPRTEATRGFAAPIDVETIWEAASRQGKRVGAITFPGVDGVGPRRTADWGLVYSEPVADSRIVRLQRKDFSAIQEATLRSHSPVLRARLRWELPREPRDVDLLVFDSTDDATENYDSFRVRSGENTTEPDQNRWFSISAWIQDTDGRALYGSWSKMMRLDGQLTDVVLYWGSISRTHGYPESFRQMIDQEVGFWPGEPDESRAAEWLEKRAGVDPQTFIEQLQRFSEFFTRSTVLATQRMQWDLLLSYQPVVDEAEHQFRILNDRQQWSTPENRAAGRLVREAAYAALDRAAGAMLRATGRDSVLVITGDHGLHPVDTSVRLNKLLVDWGFAQVENGRLSPQTRWAAFTSGNLAHLYAFEPGGDDETREVVQKLRELRSPAGDLVFERVERKTAEDHPNSGDIIAYVYPRYSFSSGLTGEMFSKTRFFGHHGGLSHHRAFHTVLLAWGRAVPHRSGDVLPQTAIASYVSRLLGIAPPTGSEFKTGSPGENASAPLAAPPRSPRVPRHRQVVAHPSLPSTGDSRTATPRSARSDEAIRVQQSAH